LVLTGSYARGPYLMGWFAYSAPGLGIGLFLTTLILFDPSDPLRARIGGLAFAWSVILIVVALVSRFMGEYRLLNATPAEVPGHVEDAFRAMNARFELVEFGRYVTERGMEIRLKLWTGSIGLFFDGREAEKEGFVESLRERLAEVGGSRHPMGMVLLVMGGVITLFGLVFVVMGFGMG